MKAYSKITEGKDITNHMYLIGVGETWLIQWKDRCGTVEIDVCLRFDGEMPFPKKRFAETCNIELTRVKNELQRKVKGLFESKN